MKMTADRILEQIREGQIQEDALKKYLGVYRTKDVEQYIEKLLGRLHNMETVYQERFEEMRTSLLDLTRERDDQIERAKALENKLKDIPKCCEAYLSEQGLITLSKENYEHFQRIDDEYNENLNKQKQENSQLLKKIEEFQIVQREAEEAKDKLDQLQIQAKTMADECNQLHSQLQNQAEEELQIQMLLKASEEKCHGQEIEIEKARARYQALDIQNQLTMDLNQQLMQEKERHEKEAVKRQERWDNERFLLIRRFNGILQGQKQCIQRLQENFAASIQCMDSLSEADFLNLSVEEV